MKLYHYRSNMKKYLLYACFITLLIGGCRDKDTPLNELSEEKIKKILQTELSAGCNLQQLSDFLKKNKIDYSIHEDGGKITSMIRPPMGMFTLFIPHKDYSVTFYFSPDGKLLKYDWKVVYTGP